METEYEGKTPEELVAMIEAQKAALAQAEQDKTATVGELKDLRIKKQELEAQLQSAQTKAEDIQPTDTEAAVNAVLQRQRQEEAKQNRAKAIEAFRQSTPEFSPASDEAGIKFSAFEREAAKFNFDGLHSVEEFKDRLKEVHEFMNRGQSTRDDRMNVHRGTTENIDSDPPTQEGVLDAREKRLLEMTGWTKERYLRLKEKQPDYVASQLALV